MQKLHDGLQHARAGVSVCPHQARPPRAAAGGGRGEVEVGEHDPVPGTQTGQLLQQRGRHDRGDGVEQRVSEIFWAVLFEL